MLTVAVQSHNRLHTLRLALVSLLESASAVKGVTVKVWDDSIYVEVRRFLMSLGTRVVLKLLPADSPPESKIVGDQRCGEKRRLIVNDWLVNDTSRYLMLIDDDIICGSSFVGEILRDMLMLQSSGLRVGGLAAHGGHTVHREFMVGSTMFANLRITGEARVVLVRDAIAECGNMFGPHPQGYADTQWRAFEAGEFKYLTRINPPYEVQHIGIGDGSIIQHQFRAFWLRDLWRANTPGKPVLHVDGFDAKQFVADVQTSGCRAACNNLWNTWERGMAKHGSSAMKITNKLSDMTGRLTIRVRRSDGTVERTVVVDNVVLDQTYSEICQAFAGNNQSGKKIDRMQLGVGLTPEQASDTGLEAPIVPILTITSYAFPTSKSLRMTAFLLETQANGFSLSELALLFANGVAVTRVTFQPLLKAKTSSSSSSTM